MSRRVERRENVRLRKALPLEGKRYHNRRRPDRRGQWRLALTTSRQLLYRLALSGALTGALALAVWGGKSAWEAAKESRYFMISEVEIRGAERISREEIEETLGLIEAGSLLTYDVKGAAEALLTLPYAARAEVERKLPNKLIVTLTERKPIAILALSSLYLVDEEGAIFKRLGEEDPDDLPVVTGLSREALEEEKVNPRLVAALRALKVLHRLGAFHRLPVAEVHLEEDRGITLVLAPTGTRVSLGEVPEDGAGVAARLERLEHIAQTLARRNTRAKAIFLDNVSRPERVAVQIR